MIFASVVRQFTIVLIIYVLCAPSAQAESASPWEETEQSRLRLISAVDGVKGHDSIRIGLQVQLQKGWKIYWRSPGDAGIPPQFDWSGSTNFKQSIVHWPAPEEFDVFGLTTWGYQDEVVYPITVEVQDATRPLDLKLSLFYGICEQVCIPYRHEFTLNLPSNTGKVSTEAGIISEFSSLVPPLVGDEFSSISMIRAKKSGGNRFSVTAVTSSIFNEPKIALEGKEGVFFTVLSSALSEDRKTVNFEIEADMPNKADRIAYQPITVTVFDRDFASEESLIIE
jgi:DsbC/DsbD-like thiol-disulfide interchange protein